MTFKDNMEEIRSYFIEIFIRLNDIEKKLKENPREKMIAQYNRLMEEEALKNKEDRIYGDERYTDHGRIED